MKRRDFIKNTAFTVLSASVLSHTSLFASSSASASHIPINAMSHIRHGNLAPLTANLKKQASIIFQLNEFKDGLNRNVGNDEMKVLSILNQESKFENIQLSIIEQQAHVLIDEKLETCPLHAGKPNRIKLTEHEELLILTANAGEKIELETQEKLFALCYNGSASVNGQSVSTKKGLKIENDKFKADIKENNTVLVGVISNSNTKNYD